MTTELGPEIKEMSFSPLSKTMLENVLKRTLEYDFTDHVLAIEAWQVVSGVSLDYRKVMRDIASLLMGDTWYLISKEPSDSGVPVLVLQKERVNALLAGASSGGQGMVVVMVTAASKQDLAFAGKAIEKFIASQRKQF